MADTRNAFGAYPHCGSSVVTVLPRQDTSEHSLQIVETSKIQVLGDWESMNEHFCRHTGLVLNTIVPLRVSLTLAGDIFNIIAVLAFTVHYMHRVFIYPLRHYRIPRARQDRVPLLVPVSAFMFCFVNGLAQSLSGCHFNYSNELRGCRYFFPQWISSSSDSLEGLRRTSLWDVLALLRFLGGLALFVYGMVVNIRSDEHLLELKRRALDAAPPNSANSPKSCEAYVTLRRSARIAAKRDGDDIVTFKCPLQPGAGAAAYKIPRLGWFQVVSCANYWGEICEWFGYAIMCNTGVSLSFAVFTLMFLGRRGVQTHSWYKGRFGEKYPKNRYAVIPYIL